MGTFEIIAMVVALVIMFAAVGSKILTTQLLNRMQNSIAQVNHIRQKTLGEFKLAQSQKKVAEKNRAVLNKKKAKIQKKIGRLRKELSGMQQEVDHRQKMRDTMRGKLVRPTIATSQQEGEDPGEMG